MFEEKVERLLYYCSNGIRGEQTKSVECRVRWTTNKKQKSGLTPAFHVFGNKIAADGFLAIQLITLSEELLL